MDDSIIIFLRLYGSPAATNNNMSHLLNMDSFEKMREDG